MKPPKLWGLPREDNQQIQLCFYVKFPSFGSFLRSCQTTFNLDKQVCCEILTWNLEYLDICMRKDALMFNGSPLHHSRAEKNMPRYHDWFNWEDESRLGTLQFIMNDKTKKEFDCAMKILSWRRILTTHNNRDKQKAPIYLLWILDYF